MVKSRSRGRSARARTAAAGGSAAAENHYRQGLAAYAAGDYKQTVDRLQKAIALQPRIALWHTQLGAALRAVGQVPEAIAAHRRAIALEPGLAAAHNNLGNALRAAGELDAAEAALREASALLPDYAEAWANLARLLVQRGRLAEAEAAFRRVLELQPQELDAHRNLGALCRARGDFAGAERHFRAWCALQPQDGEALLGLAAALDGQGRVDEADRIRDRALAVAPDNAEAHLARARRSERRGDAAAARHYREALARRPRTAEAYLALARLPGPGLGAEDERAIRGLLAQPDLGADERASLCYALARLGERHRQWDAAFRWARRANEIERGRTQFDELADLAFVQRTIAAFPAGFAASLAAGSASERPIFVVGMPRSGIGLVERLIAGHRQAAAGGALGGIAQIADRLAAEQGTEHPYPDCVRDLDAAQLATFAAGYLETLDRVSQTALRIVDASSFNFRHLGLIAAVFPRAAVVHCRRTPLDVAVSCYFSKFRRPLAFACDLFALGASLRHYDMLMAHWRTVFPRMLEVQYEELVADPAAEARRLIDFCGLTWDESVLATQHMHRSAVGRWQHYGRHLAPLFAELDGRPSLLPRPPAAPSPATAAAAKNDE